MTKPIECPVCHTKIPQGQAFGNEEREDIQGVPIGATGFCYSCMAMVMLTEERQLRAVTPEDLAKLSTTVLLKLAAMKAEIQMERAEMSRNN